MKYWGQDPSNLYLLKLYKTCCQKSFYIFQYKCKSLCQQIFSIFWFSLFWGSFSDHKTFEPTGPLVGQILAKLLGNPKFGFFYCSCGSTLDHVLINMHKLGKSQSILYFLIAWNAKDSTTSLQFTECGLLHALLS